MHIITGSCIKAAGASILTLYYSALNSVQKSPQLDSHSSPHLESPLFSRSSRDRADYLTLTSNCCPKHQLSKKHILGYSTGHALAVCPQTIGLSMLQFLDLQGPDSVAQEWGVTLDQV